MEIEAAFVNIQASSLSTAIRHSLWLFPAVEAVHLCALALLGGTVLYFNLRLLGFQLTGDPAVQCEQNTRPWMLISLAVLILSGSFLFISEPVKLYEHEAFWVKLSFLFAALVFDFSTRRRLANLQHGVWLKRASAMLSLTLWLSVSLAGRWIGFS